MRYKNSKTVNMRCKNRNKIHSVLLKVALLDQKVLEKVFVFMGL